MHYRLDGQPLSSVSNVTRDVFPLNKLPNSICIKNIEGIFVKHFKIIVCVWVCVCVCVCGVCVCVDTVLVLHFVS